MKAQLVIVATLMTATCSAFGQAKPRMIPTGPESVIEALENTLFNGWKLTPAGRHVGINSMPLKMAISPDGNTLAAVCSGRWDGLALIDLKTEQTREWIPLFRTFNGVAFSNDGKKIFVTGGNSQDLFVVDFDGTKAGVVQTIELGDPPEGSPKMSFLAGMTVNPKTGKLYLSNEGTSEIWVVDP